MIQRYLQHTEGFGLHALYLQLLWDVDYGQFRLCSCVKISEAGRQLHVSNYPIAASPSFYHALTHPLYLSSPPGLISKFFRPEVKILSAGLIHPTVSHTVCVSDSMTHITGTHSCQWTPCLTGGWASSGHSSHGPAQELSATKGLVTGH